MKNFDLRLASTPVFVLAVALPLFAFSCDADLDTACRDGECGQGLGGVNSSGGGDTGGAGGEGPFVCMEADTNELPCDVYTILKTVCQECHIEGGIGPFVLDSWDDTQQDYFGTVIWKRMQKVVQKDATPVRMPLGQPPLPDSKIAQLNAWFSTCEEPTGCAKGEGTGGPSGGGGEGGAGVGGSGGAAGGVATGGGGGQ